MRPSISPNVLMKAPEVSAYVKIYNSHGQSFIQFDWEIGGFWYLTSWTTFSVSIHFTKPSWGIPELAGLLIC